MFPKTIYHMFFMSLYAYGHIVDYMYYTQEIMAHGMYFQIKEVT
jgi:hypothetical protein